MGKLTLVAYPAVSYKLSTVLVVVFPKLSVMCFTGLPTPAGTLSNPLPAMPVTPLTVPLSPVVVALVTEFTPPVVRPTPLFTVLVTVFEACPRTPGFFGAVTGVDFFTEEGVGLVPSAFVGLDLAAGIVFLGGVALAAEDVPVADFVTFAVFVTLDSGAELVGLLMFEATVRVRVGAVVAGVFVVFVVFFVVTGGLAIVLDVLLIVLLLVAMAAFFVWGTVETLDIEGTGFFATAGVLVVFTAEVLVVDAGVEVLASFAGALLTGVAAAPPVFVAVDVVFLTGVAAFCVVVVIVLGAVDAVFFAVEDPLAATLCRLATPAIRIRRVLLMVGDPRSLHHTLKCSILLLQLFDS